MTTQPGESLTVENIPKPPAQLMIEQAVGALLPHAASNYLLPFDTPLRWHESRMQGAPSPFSFALWVNLDPERRRTININRVLLPRPEVQNMLWSCCINEPTPPAEDRADRAAHEAAAVDYPEGTPHRNVVVSISRLGEVAVNVTRYIRRDPRPSDICTDVEINEQLSPDRRSALLDHVGAVLTLAAAQSPQRQRDYFAAASLDLASRAFDRGASLASREALAPVLAAVTQNQPR